MRRAADTPTDATIIAHLERWSCSMHIGCNILLIFIHLRTIGRAHKAEVELAHPNMNQPSTTNDLYPFQSNAIHLPDNLPISPANLRPTAVSLVLRRPPSDF